MSISLTCDKCGKLYEMPDAFAGKRARCKQCGHEFRVPTPAGAVAAAYPVAAPPRALPTPSIDDDEMLPPRPIKPLKTKRVSKKKRDTSNPGLMYWAIRLLAFGAAVFILPMFGFQFKFLQAVPESVQMGIGLVCLTIGAFCLLGSGADLIYSVIGFGVLGAAVLVFLLVIGMSKSDGPQVADSGPPPNGGFPATDPPPPPQVLPVPPVIPNQPNPPAPIPGPRMRPRRLPRGAFPPPAVPNYPTNPSPNNSSPPPYNGIPSPASDGIPAPSNNGFPPSSNNGFPPSPN